MMYLVSSVSRSGSSMMMRCLVEGGVPARYDSSHEAYNVLFGDDGYVPNPNGFYAYDTDFRSPSFFTDNDGFLVKVPLEDLVFLPSGDYTLIFMRRDPEEIRASMHRFKDELWGEEAILDIYETFLSALFSRLEARGDFTVMPVEYSAVVSDPGAQFQALADAGVPVGVDIAAGLVDPSLYRFRLEANG